MTSILRGAAATIAASVVMTGLATVAIALLGLPLGLVPTILSAATGAPATLASDVDTGLVPLALHGTVDVVPLGVAAPGVVVFGVVLLGSLRTPLRTLALRTAGAAGTAIVLLAVLSAAKGTTVDVPLPTGQARLPQSAALTVEPGSPLFTGVLAVLVLAAGCALLTRWPRTVAVTAIVGSLVPVLCGLVVTVVVALRQPTLAGVAVLFGANAVLLAVFGGASIGGPLARALPDDWLLGAAAPTALRIVVVVALVLLCAAALAVTTPETLAARGPRPRAGAGDCFRRAGVQALIAGTTLATILTGTTLAAAGELSLDVSLVIVRSPILAVHLQPDLGRALLVGALAGALAGFTGSLTADVRWRAQRRLIRRIRAYG